MLYDVPTSDDAYTGAVVNTTTINADCGLLSNASVGYWNNSLGYIVNISGLGEVALQVAGMDTISYVFLHLSLILEPNLVWLMNLDAPWTGMESVSFSKPICVNIHT